MLLASCIYNWVFHVCLIHFFLKNFYRYLYFSHFAHIFFNYIFFNYIQQKNNFFRTRLVTLRNFLLNAIFQFPNCSLRHNFETFAKKMTFTKCLHKFLHVYIYIYIKMQIFLNIQLRIYILKNFTILNSSICQF